MFTLCPLQLGQWKEARGCGVHGGCSGLGGCSTSQGEVVGFGQKVQNQATRVQLWVHCCKW